ncbi:putative holin-like toxin [Enterococcus mundtii]|uniref:putative holin-like toxin n=1 Tax=Enterococcus mundtii TaxID=53346 RepID=UPI0035C17294
MSSFEAMQLMIAFAMLVLLIINYIRLKKEPSNEISTKKSDEEYQTNKRCHNFKGLTRNER